MKKSLLLLVVVAFFVPAVSAEIILSQPVAVYNIGDEINLAVSIRPASQTSDFLKVVLLCPNGQSDIYRNAFTLNAGDVRDVPLIFSLGKNVIRDLKGDCYFVAGYGGDYAESSRFKLSNSLALNIEIKGSPADPGEVLYIGGTARKENGQNLEGFIVIVLDGINGSFSSIVENGTFYFNITVPSTTAGGQHILKAHAFEKDANGRITNEENSSMEFIVRTVIRKLDIEFENMEVAPNSSLKYTVYAYDQSDNSLERDTSYIVYGPGDSVFLKDLTKTKTEHAFFVSENATPGYWKIEASIGEILTKKLFYVSEYEHAVFEIANETFSVTNKGNVRYVKTLEIGIGEYRELLNVDLDVGQTKRFKLTAPSSIYDIKISDGSATVYSPGVALTGRAVGIGEISSSPISRFALGLFLLVLVGLVFAANIFIIKRRDDKQFAEELSAPRKMSLKPGFGSQGMKEQAHVIALKANAMDDNSQGVKSDALSQARKAGAHVYEDGAHTILVFSPRLTKKTDNALLAVKTAQEIAATIEEHNSKSKERLAFGVGITRGEIVSGSQEGHKVTALGSLIPATKRLANASRNDVLLSDEVYKTVMHAVKAEKAKEASAWRLKSVIDRSSQGSFIKSFLNRNNFS